MKGLALQEDLHAARRGVLDGGGRLAGVVLVNGVSGNAPVNSV